MKNLWESGPKDQDCNKHGIIIVFIIFFEDYSFVRCRGCNKHTYSVGKLREVDNVKDIWKLFTLYGWQEMYSYFRFIQSFRGCCADAPFLTKDALFHFPS